jgi:hypothetical protein
MKRLLAVWCGIAGAAFGWIAGAWLAPVIAAYVTLPDIVGLRGLAAYGGVAELGALAGLILGVWIALRFFAGHRSFGALAWRGLLAILVAGVISYGVIRLGNTAFSELGLNASVPTVEFEIRFPAAAQPPANRGDAQVELHTDVNQMIATVSDLSEHDGRLTLRGTAPLVFRTSQRRVILSLPGDPIRSFRLRLQANPSATADFGPWQQVDYLDQAGMEARRTDVTDDYSIRYRVR